ncbi:MAG: hypothetical protein RLZZ227_1383 [Pseudomonadota bacterium]|jgi:hypothetical protein
MKTSLKNSIYKYYNGQEPTLENGSVPVPSLVDRFRGTWNDHVDAAKYAFTLLSERELVRSEGRSENLAWLLQGRYTMSPRDAKVQVEKFIQKCGY